MVEFALAAADAAEVEAQRREAARLEHVEQLVDDLVVHRTAELRVRMQHDGDRGVLLLGRLVSALKATGGSVEDDFVAAYSIVERFVVLKTRNNLSPRTFLMENIAN